MADAAHKAETAPRRLSHLPFVLAVLAAAGAGLLLAPSIQGIGLSLAAALPAALLIWAVLYFGYAAQRRPGLAGPYFIVLWAAAAGAILIAGAWQAWLDDDATRLTRAATRAETKAAAAKSAALANAKPATATEVTKLIDDYFATIRAGAQTYIEELRATGALAALSSETLSAQGGVNAAPERLRAGREVTHKHRDIALARTDAAIAALKALPANTPERTLLIEDMLIEMADVRDARADYWTTLDELTDETAALADILIRAEGTWRVNPDTRLVAFDNDADHQAYDARNAAYGAVSAKLDRILGELSRSAEALRGMASRW